MPVHTFGIELELAVLLLLVLLGTEIFAPFEVETPPWRKILKWSIVIGLTLGLYRFLGHWALVAPLGLAGAGLAVHWTWCRRHGIDPLKNPLPVFRCHHRDQTKRPCAAKKVLPCEFVLRPRLGITRTKQACIPVSQANQAVSNGQTIGANCARLRWPCQIWIMKSLTRRALKSTT